MCITEVVQLCHQHPDPAQHQPLLYKKIPSGKNHPGDLWKGEGKKGIGLQSDLWMDEGKL